MAPRLYTSDRVLSRGRSPRACSGLMYEGVPSALPTWVADEPDVDGASVCSPLDGSARPTALASPQSTTSVSPCVPRMILAGLISRCSTPREWA